MRIVRFYDYGPPEVLRVDELPDPEPQTGEVLIRVSAAGVNFTDVQIRSGALQRLTGMPAMPLPVAPGFEVAGTIVATGPGGDIDLIGKEVLARLPGGGYADLVVANRAAVIPIPEGMASQTALALLTPGATAVGVLEAARIAPGETVLISAAAGSVGSALVRLASRAGARVVGLASGDKAKAIREAGAIAAVDYQTGDWVEHVRTATGGAVDVALDSIGGSFGESVLPLLKPGRGRLVMYGFSSGQLPEIAASGLLFRSLEAIGFAQVALPAEAQAALIDRALQLGASGELLPSTGQTFPLAEAAAAHRAIEARRTIGKTLLIP
jgi:NADPH2:quinone reductase